VTGIVSQPHSFSSSFSSPLVHLIWIWKFLKRVFFQVTVHVPCWVDVEATRKSLDPVLKKYEELSKKGMKGCTKKLRGSPGWWKIHCEGVPLPCCQTVQQLITLFPLPAPADLAKFSENKPDSTESQQACKIVNSCLYSIMINP
jgi:hypothetical protein